MSSFLYISWIKHLPQRNQNSKVERCLFLERMINILFLDAMVKKQASALSALVTGVFTSRAMPYFKD